MITPRVIAGLLFYTQELPRHVVVRTVNGDFLGIITKVNLAVDGHMPGERFFAMFGQGDLGCGEMYGTYKEVKAMVIKTYGNQHLLLD